MKKSDQDESEGVDGLLRLAQFVKLARLHDEKNTAVVELLTELTARLSRLTAAGAYSVLFSQHGIYVNKRPIKAKGQGALDIIDELRRQFEVHGIGGMTVRGTAASGDLLALADVFRADAPAPGEGNVAQVVAALTAARATRGIEGNPPFDFTTPEAVEKLLAARKGIVDAISQATLAYGRLCVRAAAVRGGGGDRSIVGLRRAIVSVIEGAFRLDFEDRLQILTAVPAAGDPAGRHAANVAILAIFAGRSAGFGRRALVDLAIAAVLHPEREGASIDTTELLKLASHSDAGRLALVCAHECREGAPAADARLETRLIAAACQLDNLLQTSGPTGAKAALETLESSVDPVAARALSVSLGPYPRGSFVRLDTGEVGLVVGGGARRGEKPRVRVVLDASDEPCEPREVEALGPRAPSVSAYDGADPAQVSVVANLLASGPPRAR